MIRLDFGAWFFLLLFFIYAFEDNVANAKSLGGIRAFAESNFDVSNRLSSVGNDYVLVALIDVFFLYFFEGVVFRIN